mmetsp:Transcript_75435/g.221185  ORF Transcript_75435/g.221185 Transcript_75435/m.221185 type:complete len:261 (+) Transcript_75435:616-1398(+)
MHRGWGHAQGAVAGKQRQSRDQQRRSHDGCTRGGARSLAQVEDDGAAVSPDGVLRQRHLLVGQLLAAVVLGGDRLCHAALVLAGSGADPLSLEADTAAAAKLCRGRLLPAWPPSHGKTCSEDVRGVPAARAHPDRRDPLVRHLRSAPRLAEEGALERERHPHPLPGAGAPWAEDPPGERPGVGHADGRRAVHVGAVGPADPLPAGGGALLRLGAPGVAGGRGAAARDREPRGGDRLGELPRRLEGVPAADEAAAGGAPLP